MEVATTNTDQSLQKFKPYDLVIAQLKADCSKLTISGIEDTEGYEKVKTTKVSVRDKINEVDTVRKSLVDDSTKFVKSVNDEARRIRTTLEEIKADLQAKQDVIDNEKERIKEEKRVAKQKLITDRINGVIAAGMEYDDFLECYMFKDFEGKIVDSYTQVALVAMQINEFNEVVRVIKEQKVVKDKAKADAAAETLRLANLEKELITQKAAQEKIAKEQADKEAQLLEYGKQQLAAKEKELVARELKMTQAIENLEKAADLHTEPMYEADKEDIYEAEILMPKIDAIPIKIWMDQIIGIPVPKVVSPKSKIVLDNIVAELNNWHTKHSVL